ncbi:iporin [Thalassophryne amazonica]|uniref:iporin n=1 Tax=Thalassophryne amazonica TaxID=390379 RepID=UPI001472157A|nr:iporin [Thalassophryne amazonica]
MIRASSLSGDTLIERHFPVVQLPNWQLSVQSLCSSAKRSSRPCSMGLTRAVSLPEQNSLNRKETYSSSRRHASSSYSSLTEERAEEEGGSDSSGRYDSTSSPEDIGCHLKKESSRVGGSLRPHNSFLPNVEFDDDEEEEDIGGDNLHKYHEDSSFLLHGNSNWSNHTMPVTVMDNIWGGEEATLGGESPDHLDSLHTEPQCFNGEQDSPKLKDNMFCYAHRQYACSSELFSNSHPECCTDSSCNSSDGVLVNFCAIYNKSNNPATPHNLSSPAIEPSHSSEGAVFLNLKPVTPTPAVVLQDGGLTINSPSKEAPGLTAAPCWSPQSLDPNCNLYTLEPLPKGLTSLEVSDLTACFQSKATLAIGTNQKYYKLVTCDLYSRSPSPAWSSLTSCPEGLGHNTTFPPCERCFVHQKKKRQQKKVQKSSDFQMQSRAQSTKCQGTSTASNRLSGVVDQEHCDSGAKEKTKAMGASSLENPAVRYNKAQRPTSLPIQPFVLAPAGKPPSQSQHLGCLLEQYMNRKSSKYSSSQPRCKFTGKTSFQASPKGSHCSIFPEAPSSSDTCSTCTPSPECFGHRHIWSQGHKNPHSSEITSNPTHTRQKPTLVEVQNNTSSRSGKTHTDTFFNLTNTNPNMPLFANQNQSNIVKIPTCQDLTFEKTRDNTTLKSETSSNHSQCHGPYSSLLSCTPPTLLLTTDTTHPCPQLSPPKVSQLQQRSPHAHESGILLGSFRTALSSVAPFSSLSSLLSADSGLNPQQARDSLGSQNEHSGAMIRSDRPPSEFCLSPDMSYESISISHLQRKGLLRSVSRAMDLIMAHFGSSRDPEEKIRLGNSSQSPTIVGLVLEHLCPSIQNILEDGLRDHKLDFIIGQCHNHSWSVVEVSIRTGPSTRVLDKLVAKIRQCPQLSSHCMRLRAFIMGLLNLRALEFWLSHLQSQKGVVNMYYHPWGFLAMSLERCQPMFQELLLLLQPLSVLPFDLNLLLEHRLLRNRQLCPEEQGGSPPPPCSALLVTSWPQLQADRMTDGRHSHHKTQSPHSHHQLSPTAQRSSCLKKEQGDTHTKRSPSSAHVPQCWPVDVMEEEGCTQTCVDTWSQISIDKEQDEERAEEQTPTASACIQSQSPCAELRWAKLFGASAATSTRTNTILHTHSGEQAKKRPSQWLHLDRSQFGLLAQSIRSMKIGGTQTDKDQDN